MQKIITKFAIQIEWKYP